MSRPLVSIVCPAFQEEEVLPIFHEELCAVLDTLTDDYAFEIIYVDDGSRDLTLFVLQRLAWEDERVRYRSLSRNFGHQTALTAGLDWAEGDFVISMDADLQHPPALLPALLEKAKEGYEVVLTIRAEDPRLSWFKRTASRLFYRMMGLVSEVDVRTSASDFRLMSKRALDGLKTMRERHRFVRGMVQWLGFKTAEIAFAPDQRRAGVSKYTFRKMLSLAQDGLFSFSRVPLRLASYLGWTCLGLSIPHVGLAFAHFSGLAAYFTFLAHLFAGGVLLALGALGEYVGRTYEEVKGRPLYLVKEESHVAQFQEQLQREAA